MTLTTVLKEISCGRYVMAAYPVILAERHCLLALLALGYSCEQGGQLTTCRFPLESFAGRAGVSARNEVSNSERNHAGSRDIAQVHDALRGGVHRVVY
jgi:hypothetical protein